MPWTGPLLPTPRTLGAGLRRRLRAVRCDRATATAAWASELQDALGPDNVLLDPDVTAAYARDQAMLEPAGSPAAVVLPRSTADVVAVMQVASRHGVPVVPRGAGSGLVGGANAVDGCITLVLTRMDAVLEVAPADQLAVVQPGVVNKALRDAVPAPGCSIRRTRPATTGARSAATCR